MEQVYILSMFHTALTLHLLMKLRSLGFQLYLQFFPFNLAFMIRGGASFEKVGWTRGKIYCQKVYLMFFMSFLLWNKC